jgi:integrase
VIRVTRAYDPKGRVYVEPKSRAGKRAFFLAHKMRSAWSDGLAFGREPHSPFTASNVWRRAQTAWARASLSPIGLHEARHTFASLMIAAGVNVKALSTCMGHSTITITLDRYGHLMPGSEDEAAGLLDAYLERSAGQKWASEGQ